MKKLILLAIIAVAGLVSIACMGKKESGNAPEKKALVLYYSQTGTTKAVAEEIARLTGADIEAVDVTEPYDGTYEETIQRCLREREEGTLPTLKPLGICIDDYNTIYLGYPIWFGTYAPPIAALIDELSLEGKTIVPFCTFGSGGLEASVRQLREKFPDVEILDGYGVRTARIKAMPAEVDRWLKEAGVIEGEVEPLPAFSGELPVCEEEIDIFNRACGDYQFPLGTPVSYANRFIPGERENKYCVEYKFTVDNQSTIFVLLSVDCEQSTEDGEHWTVEFTKVVR